MSADLLRRAAAKLREAAGKASAGPWNAADDGLVWPDRMGDPAAGSSASEDAEYIALMHPPVALALAAALERAADSMAEIVFLAETARATEPHLAHLADLIDIRRVARAILREPEGGSR